jgi:DMSO/TMAO reductase YedYZ molybdopterin-dependent catalytic subunit
MKKKKNISRRKAILAGLSSVGGLMLLPGCNKPTPPTYGNILRMGDALTYVAHRSLLPGQSLAKEYQKEDITSFPATGTTNPGDPARSYMHSKEYEQLHKDNFINWSLKVEGRVSKPQSFSMADFKMFPSKTQITRHTCEEGWSAIGEWTGVQLSRVLEKVGVLPSARFINFYCYDGYIDSIDMLDAFHPQTLLAYEMNGKELPLQHGAPIRLRVERQIGYKSLKYLQRIVVSDEFVDLGDSGWAWYVGI